jgi:hypothetical protein
VVIGAFGVMFNDRWRGDGFDLFHSYSLPGGGRRCRSIGALNCMLAARWRRCRSFGSARGGGCSYGPA